MPPLLTPFWLPREAERSRLGDFGFLLLCRATKVAPGSSPKSPAAVAAQQQFRADRADARAAATRRRRRRRSSRRSWRSKRYGSVHLDVDPVWEMRR